MTLCVGVCVSVWALQPLLPYILLTKPSSRSSCLTRLRSDFIGPTARMAWSKPPPCHQ